MPSIPRTATVVIPCYNYARFVGQAIQSALDQSLVPLEVIVVDDGSTDQSRDVIASFGDCVRSVFKANGGQASAINAGCRLASGDAVFLLDADDSLEPDAVETVLSTWAPGSVMTHFRLRLVDADNQPIRGTVPASWLRLDSGDVRTKLLTYGGFATSVTSGLAFRRDALERVLPVPEDRFRQGADGYLVRAVAFLGTVNAVERPLVRYRRHGQNDSEIGSSPGAIGAGLRKRIAFGLNEFETVKSMAREHGLPVVPDLGMLTPDFLLLRLCSLVADPAKHPFPGDSRLRLLPRTLVGVLTMPGPGVGRRLAMAALAGVAALPPALGRVFLRWWYDAAVRPRWIEGLTRFVVSSNDPVQR